jgi:FkbM family methyltransferase
MEIEHLERRFKKSYIINNKKKIFKYEQSVQFLLKRILKKQDVVYDIGANIGLFSLALSNIVGNKGRILSFEPNSFLEKSIKKNLKKYKVKNVTLIKKAISNFNGKSIFYIDARKEESSVGSSLKGGYACHIEEHEPENRKNSIKVEVVTLDNFIFKNFGKIPIPCLIKIDVEGCESEVLKGSKTFIESYQPFILVEYNCIYARRKKFKLVNFLKKLGYDFFIDADRLLRIDQKYFNRFNKNNKYWLNILALPKNKKFYFHKKTLDIKKNFPKSYKFFQFIIPNFVRNFLKIGFF